MMTYFETFIAALFFFLPAYLGNMAPVIAAKFSILEKLNMPVDLNKKFHGNPLFGKTKTIRGFVVGIIVGVLTGVVQFLLLENNIFSNLVLFEYSLEILLFYGFILSFGALLGDLIKSFFKRRINVKSSKSWFLFDQIDYTFGAILLISPFFLPSVEIIIILLIVSPLLSFLSSFIGYHIGWKKVWW